jgi:hypothetical protein
MHPFVLVAVDQDQEFGQGKKVSIPQRQIFELPLNDTCKGTKYPNGVPIEGVKKRRYEKELRLFSNSGVWVKLSLILMCLSDPLFSPR